MRIMTSNIWGNFFNNPPVLREENLYKVYKKYDPDVIGFQETACGWYDVDLFRKLSERYYFIGIDCYDKTNSTPLAVKKDYTIISYGHEQLEGTPDWSKSITWAVIEKEQKRFAVCNTHFWWMRGAEREELRKRLNIYEYTLEDHCSLRSHNARQLSELMIHLSDKYSIPVFAFGDFNATISEGVFDVFAENGIQKIFELAEHKDLACSIHPDPVCGADGMFHGKKATPEYIAAFRKILCLPNEKDMSGYFSSIDHIVAFGENFEVKQYRVVEDQEALDASDHSPVFADIEWKNEIQNNEVKEDVMGGMEVERLFDIEQTIAKDIFEGITYPWEILPKIKDYILELGKTLPKEIYEEKGENIWIAKSAKIAPTACLNGPLIVDEDAEIRHCAFVRESAIVGKGAVVGNSTELKNVILFNQVQVPHYNYVGDSVLGYKAHMGAGAITSNVKSDKTPVVVKTEEMRIETGLKKFGAILGDNVEVGCNSVLNPGTIIGKKTNIYPTSCVRGMVPECSIYKNNGEIVKKD